MSVRRTQQQVLNNTFLPQCTERSTDARVSFVLCARARLNSQEFQSARVLLCRRVGFFNAIFINFTGSLFSKIIASSVFIDFNVLL